ncbi:hypothetical protein [Chryseobacterium daeguense]|uniref:hypothetical protein n=1 Tax=Chryseobacterium daeguense TaxID=412438 RepID=UPI0012DC48C4|nr:hypothetical protein [Chryseobacterium daeguense]
MSRLIGGGFVQTSSTTRNIQNPNGYTCVQTTVDGYNDDNGNGKWDRNETKSTCSQIDCNVN